MSYFLYLRAVIHQGTDRKLMKKKDKECLTWCFCVLVWSRGMCLCVEGGCYASVCECVHAKASYRVFFFSSPLDFPPLGR